ncbi:hypothetical protein CDAR_176431 [Caerostris darwini]|uniref:Uncharacterized protein n=1 Tax=Caerostris darwini TaxID=1538125 RepID=A0AAV4QAZ4_9ARAC|nr:hypothetical protein CDAR_176431 [Caerostris darwini]
MSTAAACFRFGANATEGEFTRVFRSNHFCILIAFSTPTPSDHPSPLPKAFQRGVPSGFVDCDGRYSNRVNESLKWMNGSSLPRDADSSRI